MHLPYLFSYWYPCMVATQLFMYTLYTIIIPVEDLERNNGQDKPYFMNKNLMHLLNVKNKEQTDSTTMRMESVDTIQP